MPNLLYGYLPGPYLPQPAGGHTVSRSFLGRFYPEIAFLIGIIGQANNKIFGTGSNIHFNCNGNSLVYHKPRCQRF
jgi:hypothetical protein